MKVIDDVNKKFGVNSAYLLGQETSELIPVIPTGSFKIDNALGVGGIPRGRIIEIFGPESSGKTTLCQHIISNAQQMGGVAAFVDVEHALDPHWLTVCNVDIDNLVTSQPDYGEQALEIVDMYVRSKEIDLVVVDSVAALVPKAEIEGDMGDAHMALQARLMGQAMRKLAGAVKQNDCSIIFTNQLRQNIGVTWGNPEVTPGGMALRFYASVRIDLRRTESIKDKDIAIANRVKVTIKKNKVAPPFRVTEVDLYFDEGISRISELTDLGAELGIIQKSGAFYSMGEQRLAHGRENLRTLLKENLDLQLEVEDKIRMGYGMPLRRIV